MSVLARLALAAARARGTIDAGTAARLTTALTEVSAAITHVLENSKILENIAQEFMPVHDVLYLGRGSLFPLALEGALKLKEISYIHAKGYAAGELKPGPIALIDEHVPVVVAAPSGPLFDKLASDLQEAIAQGMPPLRVRWPLHAHHQRAALADPVIRFLLKTRHTIVA